jgi:TPR repeat protein
LETKVLKRRLAHLSLPILIFGALLLPAGTAAGCGWWGDGEGDSDEAIVVLPGGAIADEPDLSDPDTMANMANAYRKGDGVPRDLALARSWSQRAAVAGHSGAMNDLGQMLEAGLGGPADPEAAAFWFRKAAMRGAANAQHSLATMLQDGRGLPRDITASEYWLRQSASKGHKSAAADLAARIWAGLVAPRRPAEACLWWLIALELGHAGQSDRCFKEEPAPSEQAFGGLQEEAKTWSATRTRESLMPGGES